MDLSQRQREWLIAEVARAGLTGRGGAGYPTARKLAAVAAGHAPVVLANGTEGEPASAKDKVLMTRSPQLVLDGAVLAAEMVGALQTVIVVHPAARHIIDEAVAERAQAGFDRVRIRVRTAADRFVAGEASAVVHWVERGIPAPRAIPPQVQGSVAASYSIPRDLARKPGSSRVAGVNAPMFLWEGPDIAIPV